MSVSEIRQSVENIKKELDNLVRLVENGSTGTATGAANQVAQSSDEVIGTGQYDGFYVTTEDGQKHEVPPTYASKSRVVFGDTLKILKNGDRVYFEHLNKVPRKELSGILTKKEGSWHFLSHSGVYKVLDVAVEYYKGKELDEAIALVPEDNLEAPFAALDKVDNNVSEKPANTQPPAKSEFKQSDSKSSATRQRSERNPQGQDQRNSRRDRSQQNSRQSSGRPQARGDNSKSARSSNSNQQRGPARPQQRQQNTPNRRDNTIDEKPRNEIPISSLRVLGDDDLR